MTIDRRLCHGVVVFVTLFAMSGCGKSGPPTHPVAGRVQVSGADHSQLVGQHVEIVRADDPNVRAAGVIDDTGRFQIQTLDEGRLLSGTREGTYLARLILTDEGDGRPKPKVPRKYLDVKTSGWTVQVPSAGAVTLTVSLK